MGKIFLYTGNGIGKTTAAFGLALRAVGQGKKVIIIQFMKGRKDIGEYKVRSRLGRNFEIHQFGRKGWVNLKKPDAKDASAAQAGLKFAMQALKRGPDLMVLDEVNLAARIGLLEEKDVIRLLDRSGKTDVVLTGRSAPKSFIRRADSATELKAIKSPKRFITKRGITY
ncbi:MAG: cob(I)yrinic acid a,c-diamide adenosyltransferase [Candidatus Aenigmatarchaeota archaeon]